MRMLVSLRMLLLLLLTLRLQLLLLLLLLHLLHLLLLLLPLLLRLSLRLRLRLLLLLLQITKMTIRSPMATYRNLDRTQQGCAPLGDVLPMFPRNHKQQQEQLLLRRSL